MKLIEWDEQKFSIRIDEIDKQHQQWIGLINDLNESLVGTESNLYPEEAIESVLAFTRHHFSFEEYLMKDIDYPGFAQHKKAHDDFLSKLVHVQEELNAGHYVLRTKLTKSLKGWIESHILNEDQSYSDFLSGGQTSPPK